jgi:hypothetical protein
MCCNKSRAHVGPTRCTLTSRSAGDPRRARATYGLHLPDLDVRRALFVQLALCAVLRRVEPVDGALHLLHLRRRDERLPRRREHGRDVVNHGRDDELPAASAPVRKTRAGGRTPKIHAKSNTSCAPPMRAPGLIARTRPGRFGGTATASASAARQFTPALYLYLPRGRYSAGTSTRPARTR